MALPLPTTSVKKLKVWRCLPSVFKDTVLESGPRFTKDRRYSIQGEFGAIYFSAARGLAEREYGQRAGEDAEPVSYLSFELSVDKVVNLTVPRIRKALRISLDDLVKPRTAAERYVVPQTLARKAYSQRLHGIIAPSVHDPEGQKDDWFNVVLYPAHLLRGCLRPLY